jgi:hypothetical protein
MLEAGVAFSRQPVLVRIGLGSTRFEERMVSKAIYATGWDGDVVLESGADGQFRFVSASPIAATMP